MALKRRRLLAQGLNLGHGTDTIPADAGGTLTGDKIGIHTFFGAPVLNALDFSGDTMDEKVTSALSALPSTGGVLDMRGATGAQSFISTVQIPMDNVRVLLGDYTITGPTSGPMFRLWSGSTRYSNVFIEGLGIGQTTLKVNGLATPTGTNYANIIELSDPADTTGANFTDRVYVGNLTLDGNKSQVAQPAGGAANDLVHSGIFTNACRYSVFENLEIKNFWYMGICGGLYFQFNRLSNIYTASNGYSNSVGYAGIQIGGSSWHNAVVNHVSNGDIVGIQVYDNARYNVVSGTYKDNYHGVVLSDQSGNTSQGNHITATITNSGSQALSVGNLAGTGIQRNSTFDVNVDTTTADPGVFIGVNTTACNFNLVVRNAYGAGIDCRGDRNNINFMGYNNSQGSALANYALELTGSVGNYITGNVFDSNGATQRGIHLDANSNNNSIFITRAGAGSAVDDLGTANVIYAPLDANAAVVTNLNTSPLLYNGGGTHLDTAHVVIGSATIGGGGTVAVTLSGDAAFTSNGSYVVTFSNESAVRAPSYTRTSGSAFTITGTAGDSITYIAVGT